MSYSWAKCTLGPHVCQVHNPDRGDEGKDFQIGEFWGNTKWTWAKPGNLILPSNQKHLRGRTSLYVLVVGPTVPEYEIAGWADCRDFGRHPEKMWGGEMLPTIHARDLRPFSKMLTRAEEILEVRALVCWICGRARG